MLQIWNKCLYSYFHSSCLNFSHVASVKDCNEHTYSKNSGIWYLRDQVVAGYRNFSYIGTQYPAVCIISVPSSLTDTWPFNLLVDILSCYPSHTFCSFDITIYGTWNVYNLKEDKKTQIFHQYILIIIFTTLMVVDEIVKCNVPLSQFPVNGAFGVIQC